MKKIFYQIKHGNMKIKKILIKINNNLEKWLVLVTNKTK